MAGQAIAVRVSGNPTAGNNGLFYVHSDHLGSAGVMSDGRGQAAPGSQTRYYPFGQYRAASGPSPLSGRGYTGHRENRQLGLTYMQARFYVPSIGRFASADTIVPEPKNPQSFNRFSYTLNNPVRYTDPTGHVCYDPGADAATPGNCNGGSTPLPEPTQPHMPTRTPITLEKWEMQLLILVAINEGGPQSSQQVEYITWTILNRQANPGISTAAGFESRLESILVSDPQQYHAVFGDPDKGYPGGIFAGHLARTGPIGETGVMETYSSWSSWYTYLNEENTGAVRNVIEAYNSGATDPTDGADSFFHVPANQGEARSTTIQDLAVDEGRFRDAAAAGWLRGNGYEPPRGISRDMVYWRQYPWPE